MRREAVEGRAAAETAWERVAKRWGALEGGRVVGGVFSGGGARRGESHLPWALLLLLLLLLKPPLLLVGDHDPLGLVLLLPADSRASPPGPSVALSIVGRTLLTRAAGAGTVKVVSGSSRGFGAGKPPRRAFGTA